MFAAQIARRVQRVLRRAWARVRYPGPRIRKDVGVAPTEVDRYWNRHTVNSSSFASPSDSEEYLEWRFSEYPLFREFMDLWGAHDGQVVLDYGCGPGSDTTGFLLHTKARRVVSMDVSEKALRLTSYRLGLHQIAEERTELVHIGDASGAIAAKTGSIDYVHCGGVLHHTSDPAAILREFHRVLRPGGTGRIMIYNRDSLWFHLWTAYVRRVIEGKFTGLSIDDAFTKNTDGEDCPIARCYRGHEFVRLLEGAGFAAEYLGGYLSQRELETWKIYGPAAIADSRLEAEHRDFLRSLTLDAAGLPLHNGKHAGIGGCFRLTRR